MNVKPRLSLWIVATAVLTVRFQLTHGTAWHFFRDAVHGFGLDVYVRHPEYQFGPVAIVAAAPFTWLPDGIELVVVAAAAYAVGVYAAITIGADRGLVLLGGLALVVVWSDIAVRTTHIDDAIALGGIAVAANAVPRGRAGTATIALAIAASAKPWAIAVAPIAAAIPGRGRWLRPFVVCGLVGLTWLPFVAAEPDTIQALADFPKDVMETSSLRVFGFDDESTPSWARPAQVLLGIGLAAWLVHRGRWWAAPMGALAVRLLFDPGTHHYYAAGVVLGVLLWELTIAPHRLPWRTMAVAVLLETTSYPVAFGDAAAPIRFAVLAAVCIASFTASASSSTPSRTQRSTRSSSRSGS